MTVQVNEIIIRATITDPSAGSGAAGGGAAAANDKENMITECVEQVLEIIRREQKR